MSSPEQASHLHYEPMSLPSRRKVGLLAPFRWLRKGWRDLWTLPDISMAYGALFATVGAFITFFSLKTPQLTLNFWSGFLLVGPLLAIGLYRIAQLLEVGETIRLTRCVRVLGERRGEVALYVLFLGLLMIGWILFSGLMVAVFFGDAPVGIEAFRDALHSADGIRFLAVLFGVGAVFACLVFASSAISLPMVLDGKADIITAVVTSIKTVLDQPLTMLLWAFLVATLTLFGMATLFLGFVVIFPMLGYATWHSYRELVK